MTTQLLPIVRRNNMDIFRVRVKKMGVSYMALPGFKSKCTMPYEIIMEPNNVETTISKIYNIPLEDIRGRGRYRELVTCRHLMMYFLRTKSGMRVTEIGRRFNRDHTTVLYAITTVNNLMETDETFRNHVQYLDSILY